MPLLAFHKPKKNHPRNGYHASANPAEVRAGLGSSLPHPNLHLRTPRVGISNQYLDMNAFAELHAERLYLLNCLQYENSKSMDILRKTMTLERDLVFGTLSLGRREAKKKLARLRYHMKETDRQEQYILAQLGRLSFEIQSLDRRMLIEAEQHHKVDNAEPYWVRQNSCKNIPRNSSRKERFCLTPIEETEGKPEYYSWPSRGHAEESAPVLAISHDKTCTVMNDDLNLNGETSDDLFLQHCPKIPRSSSMESVELALMSTGSSFECAMRTKRHSI